MGGPCPVLNSPYYVNNCNYSGAFQTLEKVINRLEQFLKRWLLTNLRPSEASKQVIVWMETLHWSNYRILYSRSLIKVNSLVILIKMSSLMKIMPMILVLETKDSSMFQTNARMVMTRWSVNSMCTFMVVAWWVLHWFANYYMSICHVSQGRFWISDNYVQKSGFLPLADTNDIVMMFPQVKLKIISIKIND